MLQKARISFLLLAFAALLAPNFIGDIAKRRQLVLGFHRSYGSCPLFDND